VADYKINLQLAVKGFKDLKQLNKQVDEARKRLNEASDRSKVFNSRVKDLIITEKSYKTAVTQRTRAIDNAARSMSGMQTLEQREQQLLRRGNKLRDLRLRKEKALNQQRGIRKGLGGAVGSGIIGGGFPLLFGQGPTAAIGGALGGVAGGALSAIPGMGQFGFALSIAGTAIGSALDELTKALAKPTENIETLVTKLGLANTETGDLVLRMNELGMTSDASALLLNKFAEEFGLTQEQIKENTERMNKFNNEINLFGTSLLNLTSKVIGPLIEELNNLIQGKKPEGTSRNITGVIDFFTANAFDLDKRGSLVDEFFSPTGDKFRNPFNRANDPLDFNLNPNNLDPDDSKDKAKIATRRQFEVKELEPLKQALELEQKRLTTSTKDLNILKEKFELDNLNNELKLLESQRTSEVNQKLEDKIEKLKIVRDTQQQIFDNAKALADPFRELSNIIAQDIGNGIKGLIQGTETLNNVLRNVLNKLADAALNMAIFGNVGGTFQRGGGGILGSIFRAEGGPVKRGGSFVVGERGPELFTPGVSGMITPNHALGGSTSIVVNVDASGSSVEGDEQQGRELGRVISAAVQSELIQQKRPGGLLA
tara:strand:+ start:387 stop:2180 length:1794 start_codon:yes stop_codon:yes gene_type:complete